MVDMECKSSRCILVLDVLWREREEGVQLILGGLYLHQKVLENMNKRFLTIGLTSHPPVFKHRITYVVKQRFRKPLRLEYYSYLVRLLLAMLKISLKHKVRVVYNPGVGWHNEWLALIAKLLGYRVVSYFHHYSLPYGTIVYPRSLIDVPAIIKMWKGLKKISRFPFFKFIDYLIHIEQLKKADLLFTGTGFGVMQARILGRRGPIIMTGIGIDVEEFIRAARESESKTWDGLFVGRMAPEKGIFDLLLIWKNVVREVSNAKLAVVGKVVKQYYDEWVKMVKELGLENNIIHLGELDRRELIKTYFSSKVFVFPSRVEGAGIAVAEAMAAGLPVVAYPLPAYKHLYSEAKGLFLCNTLESIAEKVVELLKKEDERVGLGMLNREYAIEKLTWNKVVEKISNSLMQISQ